ncbi:MAG: repeat-containing protein [Limisphaerales bacterium]|nr:MAG: repeat-containing protein [Limisphaerales bacterium]KAG0510823.1 MAG: repeat-containing protein [Limisphaerales bacterium]
MTAVNDQPSVSHAMGTVTVLEDAGAQSVPGFGTFTAGPADESAQTAAYTLTADNAALFSVQPALAANGTLTFTPAANANGLAAVTVVLQDSGGTSGGGVDRFTNTFSIAVTAVNDAPSVAFATNNVIAVKDTGARTVTGFATFTAGPADESAQTPAYTLSSDNAALFSVTPAIAPGGTLTFTPAAGTEGVATVTVVVQDSGGVANGGADKATNTFTLTVVPFSTAPDSYSVSEDRLLTVIASAGVLTNDVGVGLGVRLVDAPTNGTVTLNANGSFSYLAATNFNGTDTFTYQATNSLVASEPTAVTLTVTAVNDAPAVAFSTNEVVVLEDAGAQGVAGFATFTAGPTNESAQTLVGYTVSNGSNALFSVQPAIDVAGRLTFTPATNANGSATITVMVQDSGGTGDSGMDRATNTFVITVAPVNDQPTAALAGNVTVLEDAGAQTRAGFVTSFVPGPADEAGQTPTHQVAGDNSLLFSVQPAIAPDGTLTFTPATNANGSATVTVVTSDSGGAANGGRDRTTNSFLITVTPVNDAPSVGFPTNVVAVLEDAGAQSLAAFAAFTAGPANESAQVLVGYTVSNSSNALFSAQPAIGNDGRLTFTPATNANGSVTVTVVVQDNSAAADGGVDKSTNTLTLTVVPVNDAPGVAFALGTVTVVEDAGAQSVSAFATFSSGPVNESVQALVGYSVTVGNAALFASAPAINNAGIMTFTPATNANGSATVTVVVQDNGGTSDGGVDKSTNTFTIVVTSVNDTPVAGNDSYTVSQGDALTVAAAGVLANDTDVENNPLTATKLTNPAHGTLTFNANGGFAYTPDTNFYGVDSFTYRSSDASSNSTAATVSLSVPARPVITPPPGRQRVFSSAALRFSATNAPDLNAIRVADPDSSTLTLTLTVTNGTLGVTVTNGLTFPNGSTNTNTLVLAGPITDLNAALESLAYVSITNYFGDDALVLVAQDEGGRTNRGNGVFDIQVEVPARGASLEVPLNGFNNPGLGRMVTNATAVTLDTNLVEGVTYDPTNNVVRVQPVGGQDGSTNRSTVTVLARYSDGTTELITVPVIVYQPLLTTTTNSNAYDATFAAPLFNLQTSLYEQKVRVQNNTPFDFTALRITATNLPATVTLQNATLTNGGRSYIDYNLAVAAGGSVTLKLEYFSSDLRPFTPGLKLELLNQQRATAAPTNAVMSAVAPRRGFAPDGLTKNYVQFPTRAGQLYYVQYQEVAGPVWKTSPVVITGTGFIVHWMDDGPPNTDTPPGPVRFYRVVTDR